MAGDAGRQLQDRLIAANPEQTPGILDEAFAALGMDAPFSKVRLLPPAAPMVTVFVLANRR